MDVDKEKIAARQLKPHEVGVASLIAGFHELGILNQAVVFQATQRAGHALAQFAKAEGRSPETPLDAVRLLHEMTPLAVSIEFSSNGSSLTVEIDTNTCKYCPKGVGGAELEGSLCPYPGLILGFLSEFFPGVRVKFYDRKPLTKEGALCKLEFEWG